MIFNYITNVPSCFDFINHVAPMSLVYYSHFTSIIVSLILGFVVLRYSDKSILGRLLFSLSLVFSLWVIIDLITWTSYNSLMYMFVWSFFGILTALIYLISICFSYAFIYNKNISFKILSAFSILFLPIILFTPTAYNLIGFSNLDCVSIESPLFTNYFHMFGVFAFISILTMAIIGYLKTTDKLFRRQILLMTIGIEAFIAIFFTATFLDSYLVNAGVTGDYMLGNYGLFGIIIFMAVLAFLIVRFKTFNIKLLGAQALMLTIGLLVGSQFFFIKTPTNMVLTFFTLVITIIAGIFLVKSVKKEAKQLESIEHLLKIKSEFIDIVSHQLRTPVSVIRGMASMLKEGDLEDKTKEQKDEFIAGIYEKSEKLADILNDILEAAELDMDNFTFVSGTLKPVNLSNTIKGIFDDLDSLAKEKKINYQFKSTPEIDSLTIMTAVSFLKNAFQNIIDNAIKYSNAGGSVIVELSKEKNFVICKIADSGIGIPEAEQYKMFEKFTRATNAVNAYTYGTGLGLFIARKIVEAHPGGKIWFDSVQNKGTTFYIKLPVVK